MTLIGIMQGRLVPPIDGRFQCFPRDHWEDEFALAANAKLDCIEWIYDLHGADKNPLSSDTGIEKMNLLTKTHGVKIVSLCADYFMELPLVRATTPEFDERLSFLEWLLYRCQLVGITRLVLPFVDASHIDTDFEMETVCTALNRAMQTVEKTGVEIHLETSLPPGHFSTLLSKIPHPMLKVNYDSGNSSSLGYIPNDEFAEYGPRIGSVHIKDRILGGGTVPLGMGNADFKALAQCLEEINYTGDFILQAARGSSGEEVTLARYNREFVLNQIFSKLDLLNKELK
jgi:L-ribulose-5-phosphate 3-epimerase